MILADHCVFGATVRLLRDAGYDIKILKDLISPDAADPEVLRLAVQHDWILLTNDMDFGNVIVYPPSKHTGIILLRIRAGTESETHAVLLNLLREQNRATLRQCLAVVDRYKYRLRR